jgi:hypothetical protein
MILGLILWPVAVPAVIAVAVWDATKILESKEEERW